MSERKARTTALWTLVPLGVACATLIPSLGSRSLWFDEILTVWAARLSVPDLFSTMLPRSANLLPYYGVMHFWTILGTDPWFVRAFSVIFGLATVGVLWALARKLFDQRTATVCAVLLAACAPFVSLSREARYYSLLAFAQTLSTLLFVRAVERPTRARWVIYALSGVTAALVHPLGALIILGHQAAFPLIPRGSVRRGPVLLAGIVGVAGLIPVLLVASSQGPSLAGWLAGGEGAVNAFFRSLSGSRGIGMWIALLIFVSGVLALAASLRRTSEENRWRAWVALLTLVVPLAVAVLVNTVRPILLIRYMIGTLPALALVVGAGLYRLPRRWLALTVIGALLALNASTITGLYDHRPLEDWRAATTYLGGAVRKGEPVYVSGSWGIPPDLQLPTISLLYYAPRVDPPLTSPVLRIEPLLAALENSGDSGTIPDRVWIVVSGQTEFSPDLATITAQLRAEGFREMSRAEFPGARWILIASFSRD